MAAATEMLKRKEPDLGDCSLLCVRDEVKKAKLEDPMQKGCTLQIRNDSTVLTERQAEREAFQRISLEPAVIEFASRVMSRVISGKAQGEKPFMKNGAKSFMDMNEENRALFARLTTAVNKSLLPTDLASFADENYALRNGNVHNTTDAALKKRAAQLKTSGAVRLLREELPWQCDVIEHIDDVLACLSGST